MGNVKWGVFLLILLIPSVLLSQNLSKKKKRKLMLAVDRLLEEESYHMAIAYLDTLAVNDSTCADLQFKLGLCKHKLRKYPTALIHFDRAHKYQRNSEYACKAPPDLFYYHAKTLYFTDKPDLALTLFSRLKGQMTRQKDRRFLKKIEEDIELCKQYIEFSSTSIDVKIDNVGENINSVYPEYAPVLSYDENTLIFTSKRKGSVGGKRDAKGEYYEDIYISKRVNNVWQVPKSISSRINTEDHDASMSLSADGTELLIYRPDDNGSIYISKQTGDDWSVPQKLNSTINTEFRETHACFSPDGKSLYFTSDRPGGLGGLDIYVAQRLANGDWGRAVNLGSPINSEQDEEGPFAHHDGITIYFSSKGHGSIGGYDIFYSRLENGTWTLPKNVGYSVNTSKDDVFFILSADGTKAYFASFKDGTFGETDIYQITYKQPDDQKHTYIKGKILACSMEDLRHVQIFAKNPETQQIVGVYRPNSRTGRFFMVFNPGKKYELDFDYKGETFHADMFTVEKNSPLEYNYGKVAIDILPPCDKNAYRAPISGHLIGRIYFNDLGYDIKRNDDLDKLAAFLSSHPEAEVAFTSHTATEGMTAELFQVANTRVKSLIYYLMQRGVVLDQLKIKILGPRFLLFEKQEKMKFNDRVEIYLVKPLSSPFKLDAEDPVSLGYE